MPPTKAKVTFKKKDGSLTVSEDKKYVFWIPSAPPGASPAVTILIADITNLQQTPAGKPTIALKVVIKDDSYVFTFTHAANARKEQETVTELLRNTIATNKAAVSAALAPSATSTPRPDGDNGGQSASMAIAKALASKAEDEGWYDDSKLKADFNLQRSLLESNTALKERFNQALREKPESVSISQFTRQFFSMRLHLLRAHAIENAQKQGEYNVLPEIKFTRKAAEKEGEPDTKQLQITKEQIKLIFKQYPVVRDAYNENSPPLQPTEFWTRFFGSRLLKKLKGERIFDHDPRDNLLDKYLDRRQNGPTSITHIPHFMDLEGNEQNHSQRKGNRPDQDMRQSSHDKVPILRVLNGLSEQMMSRVAPEDGEAHAPIGLDEDTFEQLRLRDLSHHDADNRVILNVKEQQRYAGSDQDDLSADAKLYAKQDPQRVLSSLSAELERENLGSDEQGILRLNRVIGYQTDDDSDSDDEMDANQTNGAASKTENTTRIGSHAAMTSAFSTIMSSITQRRQATSSDPASLQGLSQSVFDSLTMTQNTTTEFLRYFWTVFLSGDAARTNELAQLVSTLNRCVERLDAVAATAETERMQNVEKLKQDYARQYKSAAKRRRVDFADTVPGGKSAVDDMSQPTRRALAVAKAAYVKAFGEQSREVIAADK